MTRVAKRLRALVPTIDSTSWVQSLAQVRKDRLSVETPAECLGAGGTKICTNGFKKRVHSLKQQRRTKRSSEKSHRLNITGDADRCDPELQITSECHWATGCATVSVQTSAAVGPAGSIMHNQFYCETHGNSWLCPGYKEIKGTDMFLNLLWSVSGTARKTFSLQAGMSSADHATMRLVSHAFVILGEKRCPLTDFQTQDFYEGSQASTDTYFRRSLILLSALGLFFLLRIKYVKHFCDIFCCFTLATFRIFSRRETKMIK